MNQKQYIEKVLLKFGMADCKPKPTPCVLGIEKVSDEESPSLDLEDPGEYRAIVGSLIYCFDKRVLIVRLINCSVNISI
jgi:hypothetical protein